MEAIGMRQRSGTDEPAGALRALCAIATFFGIKFKELWLYRPLFKVS